MKKEKVNKIIFHCISCDYQYISEDSTEKQKSEQITSCSNCCPFYAGTLASEVKMGAVEKFRSRERKTKIK